MSAYTKKLRRVTNYSSYRLCMDSKSAENTHNMKENTNTLHNIRIEFKETTITSIFQITLSHILSTSIASFKTHKNLFNISSQKHPFKRQTV